MDGLRGNVVPHRMPQVHLLVVSMQSTGVYWIAVFDILEEAGLEVYLVNAREKPRICPGAKATCKRVNG
jgi:transposase